METSHLCLQTAYRGKNKNTSLTHRQKIKVERISCQRAILMFSRLIQNLSPRKCYVPMPSARYKMATMSSYTHRYKTTVFFPFLVFCFARICPSERSRQWRGTLVEKLHHYTGELENASHKHKKAPIFLEILVFHTCKKKRVREGFHGIRLAIHGIWLVLR